MGDGQAGLSHPPWRGGGVWRGFFKGIYVPRPDASANKASTPQVFRENQKWKDQAECIGNCEDSYAYVKASS